MKALLVIDMQVGCFGAGSPRHDADAVIERINRLAHHVRAHSGLVVFVQHSVAEDGLAPDSAAWAMLPAIEQSPDDAYVRKTACDSFLDTELDALLEGTGVDELLIVGCATDHCVDTTVRAAAALGYRVAVPRDAHTTADRPHLSAVQVIAHHHYMWRELILPGRAMIALPSTQEVLDAVPAS